MSADHNNPADTERAFVKLVRSSERQEQVRLPSSMQVITLEWIVRRAGHP